MTPKYLSTAPRYIANTKSRTTELDGKVRNLLEKSEVDLGVFCKDGKFYPSGAKFLDKELVEDALDWLNNYPKEKKDFEKALRALMEKRCDDVLSNCYNCVEGMAREILNNNKTLRSNKEPLLKKIGLPGAWGKFLSYFIGYADEYKRHASKKRHQENPNEVEAFLYLTGLIIRLCIKSVK